MRLMKSPRTMDIAITSKCNLRCLYCSYYSSPADVDTDLPKEEWFTFFEELNHCKVMSVALQGGEPLVRKDLKEIIGSIVDNRMRFSILTNGTLITDDMADFLASTNRCSYVQVSIDGSSANIHDLCRGKGNFVKAVDGLKHLLDRKIKSTVRVTIHKGNFDDLDNIAKFLLEDVGLPHFSTNSASHMGLCRKNAELIQLTAEEHAKAMNSLLRLAEKYDRRILAQAGPLANGKAWMEMEKARLEGQVSLPRRGYLVSCGGVNSKMAVRSDGIYVPCVQLSHMEMGRINKDDLIDIWQHSPELNGLRNRVQIPLAIFEYCKGCSYIPYCAGGCPGTAYTSAGTVEHPSPDGCLRKFLQEGGRLPDKMPEYFEKPVDHCN